MLSVELEIRNELEQLRALHREMLREVREVREDTQLILRQDRIIMKTQADLANELKLVSDDLSTYIARETATEKALADLQAQVAAGQDTTATIDALEAIRSTIPKAPVADTPVATSPTTETSEVSGA